MSALAYTAGQLPRVTELHDPVNGEAIEISGWLANWLEDSESEQFDRKAFDTSLENFLLGGNAIALWHHDRNLPIGEVVAAEVLPNGLYGTIRLPRPEVGTKAFEVYQAAKAGLAKGFSVGAKFARKIIGGKVHVFCERLLEVSLTPIPVGQFAVADDVKSRRDVKAFDGEWLPVREAARRQALVADLSLLTAHVAVLEAQRR
jgi:HK97 family phage prohead protease